jgi:hypothetical protein
MFFDIFASVRNVRTLYIPRRIDTNRAIANLLPKNQNWIDIVDKNKCIPVVVMDVVVVVFFGFCSTCLYSNEDSLELYRVLDWEWIVQNHVFVRIMDIESFANRYFLYIYDIRNDRNNGNMNTEWNKVEAVSFRMIPTTTTDPCQNRYHNSRSYQISKTGM